MHLVQPIIALAVEGSTHQGHCNRRVRPTSDRKRKFGVNKLFTPWHEPDMMVHDG